MYFFLFILRIFYCRENFTYLDRIIALPTLFIICCTLFIYNFIWKIPWIFFFEFCGFHLWILRIFYRGENINLFTLFICWGLHTARNLSIARDTTQYRLAKQYMVAEHTSTSNIGTQPKVTYICYRPKGHFTRNRSGWPKSYQPNGSRDEKNI